MIATLDREMKGTSPKSKESTAEKVTETISHDTKKRKTRKREKLKQMRKHDDIIFYICNIYLSLLPSEN